MRRKEKQTAHKFTETLRKHNLMSTYDRYWTELGDKWRCKSNSICSADMELEKLTKAHLCTYLMDLP